MIQLKRIAAHDLPLPKQATEGAAGFDLMAAESFTLKPGSYGTVKQDLRGQYHSAKLA